MKMYRVFSFVCFVSCSMGLLWANPQVVAGTRGPLTGANTLYGPTGLMLVPTAYTVGHQEFAVSGSFGMHVRGPAINYGLIPYVEIGAAFMDRDNASNKGIANAKITLIPQNFQKFEIGVGVIDAIDAIERSFFAVGSADFSPPNIHEPITGETPVGFKVHGGFGTGMFKDSFIGGAELLFGNKVSLVGEYDGKNFNGAVRFSPNKDMSVQLGFQKTDFFFGLTSRFRM